ncbi:TPA: hypothetical protein DEP21_03925 [Patescibacteria group bacterium]|nr:hypothetical protein [Candidatus Gracilibacteria bacterium]
MMIVYSLTHAPVSLLFAREKIVGQFVVLVGQGYIIDVGVGGVVSIPMYIGEYVSISPHLINWRYN